MSDLKTARQKRTVRKKGIFKAAPNFPGSTLPKKNVQDSDFTKPDPKFAKKDESKRRSYLDSRLREIQGLGD